MEGGIGIRAPKGLHESGENVIMLISVLIIAHGTLLGDGGSILCCDNAAVLRRGKEHLHGIHGLSHIPAAGLADACCGAGGKDHWMLPPRIGDGRCPGNGLFHLGRRNGLELKHRGTAQHSPENTEIRVFCGRGNEGDAPVLHKLQQALLLLFVEILDLVEIEQHSAGSEEGVQLVDNLLDIPDAGRGGVELSEGTAGALGNDAGHRGLARAGGTVKNHIGDGAAEDYAPQHAVFPQNMLLPDHIVQGGRPDLVCKWFISDIHVHLIHRSFHCGHPFSPPGSGLRPSPVKGEGYIRNMLK